MRKLNGKIILVDDEQVEKEVMENALLKLGWEKNLMHFTNPYDALDYLRATKDEIFIVISDMEMPIMTGLQLKRDIDSDRELKTRTIPFIFSSNSATKEQVYSAYDYGIQGYFKKPFNIDEMAKMMEIIVTYWQMSLNPGRML
jgi:CheY-like chemotaxis protein